MNDNLDIDGLMLQTLPEFRFTGDQEEDVMKLAALGITPKDMAVALELSPSEAEAFCRCAATPMSTVAEVIALGRTLGQTSPLQKLQEAASAGNLEAIKELRRAMNQNKYNNIIANMDSDELCI